MRLIILALILILPNYSYSKLILTNYQVIDSLSFVFVTELTNEIIKLNLKSINYNINEHDVKSLVEMNIIESLSDKDINIVSDELQSMMHLNIGEVKVLYDLHPDNDSLYRNISFGATATLNHDGRTFIIAKRQDSFRDAISRADITNYEDKSFAFTQGTVPEPKLSLFDKIIKPAVYVATTAVMILLLFTVRSN